MKRLVDPVRVLRRSVVRSAAIVIAPNEERCRALESTLRPDVLCVWNCPERFEVRPDPRPPDDETQPFRVLYHGSLSRDRLPMSLFQAVTRLAGKIRMVVRVYDTNLGANLKDLNRLIDEVGARPWVEFLPAVVARSGLWDALDHAHLGVSLVPLKPADFNLATMTGASNKPFDYLARGVPVLVSRRPDWTGMFVDEGYGFACDPEDPEDIARVLASVCENRSLAARMGEAGRRRILDDWNYETCFKPVLDILDEAPYPPAGARGI